MSIVQTLFLSMAGALHAQNRVLRQLNPVSGLHQASRDSLEDIIQAADECVKHIEAIKAEAEKALFGGRLQ